MAPTPFLYDRGWRDAETNNKDLATSNRLAYHGTKQALSVLKPSMPHWRYDGQSYADSDRPVICAYFNPLPAVLMALARPGSVGYGYEINADGGTTLYAQRSEYRNMRMAKGVVAVASMVEFEWAILPVPDGWPKRQLFRGPELRRDRDLVPQYNIAVGFTDLMHLLRKDENSKLDFRGDMPANCGSQEFTLL
jgi:hypothetical protein